MKLKVNDNGRTLLRNNHHFFYLADTCWSAFTSIQMEEWIIYLKKRKAQGFNTLQINILPQWDRSKGSFDFLPFPENDGIYDFSQINDAYFIRAQELCQLATEQGFTLSLVVLWANYVAGTWASDLDQEKNIIPLSARHTYFEKVIEYFDQFSPIYFIGGDTDFPTQETIETYEDAFAFFNKHSPKTLKTVHIKGRFYDIPESIITSLDLFLYQSGHNRSFLDMPYSLAEQFYQRTPKRPIINSEPCYEQMGFARKEYGRFSQKDVRKAAWQSILSGACAGITYGAHGIWSWHGFSAAFSENMGEAFDRPMHWPDALQLPGANDYGFIKQFFELLGITNLIPKNELLIKGDEQIRIAATDDQSYYLIYIPSNTAITVAIDFSAYQLTMIDLNGNQFFKANYRVKDNETIIEPHTCQEDVLIIAYK